MNRSFSETFQDQAYQCPGNLRLNSRFLCLSNLIFSVKNPLKTPYLSHPCSTSLKKSPKQQTNKKT